MVEYLAWSLSLVDMVDLVHDRGKPRVQPLPVHAKV
jgi:hypothetical protein